MSSAPRDENKIPGLIAKSDADNTVVVVEADPATKRLKVSAVLSAGVASIGTVDTELPAATALADTTVNPTTPLVGTANELFNGTTWDRARSGVQSNVAAATGYAASLGIGQYNATPPTITDTRYNNLQTDVNANMRVTLATLIAGEDLTASVQGVIQKPVTGSIYAPSTYKDTGSVTKANIKGSAGNVYMLRITNANAAVRYFQLHNKATAPIATDTAQQFWIVPAGTATAPGVLTLGINELAPSEYFASGIGWAISTTAAAFTDSATASDHIAYVRYM